MSLPVTAQNLYILKPLPKGATERNAKSTPPLDWLVLFAPLDWLVLFDLGGHNHLENWLSGVLKDTRSHFLGTSRPHEVPDADGLTWNSPSGKRRPFCTDMPRR